MGGGIIFGKYICVSERIGMSEGFSFFETIVATREDVAHGKETSQGDCESSRSGFLF